MNYLIVFIHIWIFIGVTDCIKKVYREEGYRGFYKGLVASMLAQPGYWSIYMPVFNNLKDRFSSNDGSINFYKKMWVIFTASSISSMAVNPLFVFKTR